MNKSTVEIPLKLQPGRVLKWQLSIALLLLICHVIAMQANFNESLGIKAALGFEYWQVALFDLDEEESFGTWFSSVNLLFAGLLCLYLSRSLGVGHKSMKPWWLTLGVGFCLMSIDEVVGLHELVNTVFDESVWTSASLVIVGLCAIGFMPLLWHYRWRSAGLLMLSGSMFVAGAVGLEHAAGDDVNSLSYNMFTAAEETLEMLGVIIATYVILQLIASGRASD